MAEDLDSISASAAGQDRVFLVQGLVNVERCLQEDTKDLEMFDSSKAEVDGYESSSLDGKSTVWLLVDDAE